jgi:hypothetical protein
MADERFLPRRLASVQESPVGGRACCELDFNSKESPMNIDRSVTALKRRAVSLLGALTLLAFAVPVVSSTALAESESQENHARLSSPIEGSWIFSVDRINQGTTFTAVASFTAGGVFLATGSLDRINPVSPLYGSWKHTGPNRYDSTTYFFAFNPAGDAVAMIKANQVFHFKARNELVGSGVTFSCDLQGENCVSVPAGSIHVKGRRVLVEKVDEDLSDSLPQE